LGADLDEEKVMIGGEFGPHYELFHHGFNLVSAELGALADF